MHLRLLDLDGSLTRQSTLATAAAWSSFDVVPMRDLAPALRLWARDSTMRRARGRLAQTGRTLTLIGSGDFHHLAVPLIEQAREPITVVHFDNHPDWVRWAPRWHCGSWVNEALRLSNVARVLTIGPCSDDLERPQLKGGNLAALGSGRIVLFPWQHAPSRVYSLLPDGAGHSCVDGHLVWRNLSEHSGEDNRATILAQIDTEAVWLTIDKDVLAASEAFTNWDQGRMPLQAILDLIAGIGVRKRIVGADICGEYSVPALSNLFKRIESRLDRPRREADAADLARNESVNRRLLQTIAGASSC